MKGSVVGNNENCGNSAIHSEKRLFVVNKHYLLLLKTLCIFGPTKPVIYRK
jgi:hypothetical protein